MKKFIVPVVVIALLVSATMVVFAALPGGPYSSSFRVQNLSNSSTATCVYSFYDGSGVAKYTSGSSLINSGDSLNVYVPSLSGLASGQYSGLVSCDQPVAAVVNFSDPRSGSAFAGVDSTAATTKSYAPAVYNHYYNFSSNMYIQNADVSPVNGTLSIYAAGNPTPVATQSFTNLQPNASILLEQNGLSGLNPNVSYSGIINSSGKVAAEVNFYGLPGTSVEHQLYSYNPVAGGATKAFAPIILNNYYGFNTSLTIQNLGNTSTNYTVTYGTGQVQTGNLSAGGSVALYSPASGIPSGNAQGLNGATVQSSGQPIVLLVNESDSHLRASSYLGFADGSATHTVKAPIIYRNYYNFETSVTCQNLDVAQGTLQITYANNPTHPTTSQPVNPGRTTLFYQGADPNMGSGNTLGITSATITGNVNFVCVVTEGAVPALGTTNADYQYTYNGINQ